MLLPAPHFSWCTLHISWINRVTIIQPWHTPFPIWNHCVVPCPVLTVASWPAYSFLKRQEGGLVFPSLEEFSTVYCDPHSQRLWHSQQSRNRCFSGTLLLFWWSSRCWQFDLWFLCLFWKQFKHLEVHGSHTVEAWLGEFWALLY